VSGKRQRGVTVRRKSPRDRRKWSVTERTNEKNVTDELVLRTYWSDLRLNHTPIVATGVFAATVGVENGGGGGEK